MVRKRLKWIIPVVLAAVLAAAQEISGWDRGTGSLSHPLSGGTGGQVPCPTLSRTKPCR
jgi:hypothetical protein